MGNGLLIPLRRVGADFAAGDGDAQLRSKVLQVLGTSPGELPWRPSFGCGLRALKHQSNDTVLAEIARVRIRDSFATWLPEVHLVTVRVDRADTAVSIRVRWKALGVADDAVVAL